jgi:malonyl-CoA O-methyltransferase
MPPADDDVDAFARRLDAVAVRAALRRLLRQPEAPWLHAEVGRRMAEKLPLILLKPDRVIDWWSTLGASGALLASAYPQARCIAVEPDAAWAARRRKAAERPWWTARRWTGPAVDVVCEDEPLAEGAAQMVWANMMLHAVVDPPALFARWNRLLAVDGFVMFSCLGPGTLRELRSIYARRGWGASTPGFVDMHDLGDMLVSAGFADPVMDQETLTLHWPNPAAALRELALLGGNAAPDRAAALRTPRWRQALERELGSLALADGRIGLTFEVAYGHAFKSAPRVRAGAPTTVSLDAMRAMVRAKGLPTRGEAGSALNS